MTSTWPLDCTEYSRWFRHAEYTLRAVETDLSAGNYSWSCFKAQQAAEFAIKALLRALGRPAFGHNLVALSSELADYCGGLDTRLRFCIGYLDKMYTSSRYPDAFVEGAPYERYTREEAVEAGECARLVLEWVKRCSPCR